jgi:hypothetical protein
MKNKIAARQTVTEYIQLKRIARNADAVLETRRQHFRAACETLAHGTGRVDVAGAVIYRQERRTWSYSPRIIAKMAALARARAKYEREHAPAAVEVTWNVIDANGGQNV